MRGRRRRAALMALALCALPACATSGGNEAARAGLFVASSGEVPAVLWAVGDGPDGGADARAVARMIASRAPDRLLYLGDVYDEDEGAAETDRPYVDHFGPAYGTLAKRTAPTPGNHDWDDDGDDAERVDYLAYWRRAKAVRPVTYYAFRAGGWEVLSLNSEEPHDTDSDQYEWLRSRLRGGGTCRLAFWHRPRYSAGEEHGDAEDMAPVWEALRGHARIVVSAHDHNMQRLRAIDGITSFVSGAGGRSHYDLRDDDGRLAWGDDTHYGALRLELRPGRARYAFVAVDGRTLDSGTLRCRR